MTKKVNHAQEYLGRIPEVEDIPPHVPQDLLSGRDRAHDGQIENTLFIRTWYGDGSTESQEKADRDYARLTGVISEEYGEMDEMMDPVFIFDERGVFSSLQAPDGEFSDGNAVPRPGSLPSYVLAALTHCPDQIDGCRVEGLDELPPAEEIEGCQELLVVIADRKACEDGWVLHLALDHKGHVLPFRLRDRADRVSTNLGNWRDGQRLTENTLDPEEDAEVYMDGGSNGWD